MSEAASVLVRIPAPLRAYAGGRSEFEARAATVGGALAELTARFPQLRRHLYDDAGRLRSFVNVYLNEEDVRYLEGEGTAVRPGDTLTIVPSIAGGAAAGPDGPVRVEGNRSTTRRPAACRSNARRRAR